MTGPDPSAPVPASPPPDAPPATPPAAPPPAAAPPPVAASGAPPASPHPAQTGGAAASAEQSLKAAEGRAAAVLDVSGADTLIVGGAALLVVGEFLFGTLLGGTNSGFFSVTGFNLQGVLAAEVLLFVLLLGPRPGKAGTISAGATRAVVSALIVAIFIYVLGEFIFALRNLSAFTSLGIVGILEQLAEWAGGVLMLLGLLSTSGVSAAPKPPAAKP